MTDKKTCPYCGEEIAASAKKCRFCGEWLDGNEPQPHQDTENSIAQNDETEPEDVEQPASNHPVETTPVQEASSQESEPDDAEEIEVPAGRSTGLTIGIGFAASIVMFIVYGFLVYLSVLLIDSEVVRGYALGGCCLLIGAALGKIIGFVSQKESLACGLAAAVFSVLVCLLFDVTVTEIDLGVQDYVCYFLAACIAFGYGGNFRSDDDDKKDEEDKADDDKADDDKKEE